MAAQQIFAVPNTPPASFAFKDAKPDTGRVFDLKRVARTDEIPSYRGLVSDMHPSIVAEGNENQIVVLEVGPLLATILWTNRSVDLKAFQHVTGRLKFYRYTIVDCFETTPSLISACTTRHFDGKAKTEVIEEVEQNDMTDLLDDLLRQAAHLKASDIHLQVGSQFANVLMRVHGDLQNVRPMNGGEAEALSRAIFALADNDSKAITFDPRASQGASVTRSIKIDESTELKLKLRYASMPTVPDGWDIVLRVLTMGLDTRVRSLEELGYNEQHLHDIHRMLARPTGMIMLVGTTGSGKSTTLQTMCRMLDERYQGRKLIRTIEDPPEYIIKGARQTPVVRRQDAAGNEANAAAFGNALIAAMRTDPDVLMIGEIRDEITARAAQQAVQTGHKVLTTLHAGSPFDALQRLCDLGVNRSVLTDDQFVSGVIYQKLIPLVCPECAVSFKEAAPKLAPDLIQRLQRACVGQDVTALRFRGKGCERCKGTGIVGRTVVAEMLVPDRDIQKYVRDEDIPMARAHWRAGVGKAARSVGRTALDHAIAKMLAGLVSPSDVEHELGDLDDQESQEQVRQWLNSALVSHNAALAKRRPLESHSSHE